MNGAELIAQERQRQISGEGWSAEHDDQHLPGDMADAAKGYLVYAWWQLMGNRCGWSKEQTDSIILEDWPWDEQWWKPSDDPERNLVKAGALIAAEIDRLQRQHHADQVS